MHVHGGAFVAGSAGMMDRLNGALAVELGCAIFSVDYRLAPESPHPGPVEDCFAALQWLQTHAEDLAVDRARIAIKGESAGAGLAAALAILARDRGAAPIAFQQLLLPILDDRTCLLSEHHPFTGEYGWTIPSNIFAWTALLGEPPGGPNVSPHAAPARALNLAALPPAFISVGALDLFLEESMDYARRLTRAGVSVELHVYPGAPHGADAIGITLEGNMPSRLAVAALRDSTEAMRRALFG